MDQRTPSKQPDPEDDPETIEEASEEQSVARASRLSAKLIYEVIRRDGEEELERPVVSLIWSGLAAGILISLSVIAQAVLRVHLPDTPSAFLVEAFGYSLGFMVVILGRMQLFTENTITTVLPVVARRSLRCGLSMARLWSVVLVANVVGALIASAFMSVPGVFPAEVAEAMREISAHAMSLSAGDSFLRAIPAGFLVAALVWMMPSAEHIAFFVILTFTWLIAAGEFTHIIAGSVEMGLLLWSGELSLAGAVGGFFLPVLAGNVIGGTAIFTLLAWGQVKNEVTQGRALDDDREGARRDDW